MTEEQLRTLRELHQAGYAVCVFIPDEIGTASQTDIEDAMVEAGWKVINTAYDAAFN